MPADSRPRRDLSLAITAATVEDARHRLELVTTKVNRGNYVGAALMCDDVIAEVTALRDRLRQGAGDE
jgi:hypothetical protein